MAFKKGLSATKGGEAAFKLGVDGCYFNANASISESFKMLEDAIVISGANDHGRKIFQIGFNADADNAFNKDPRDPNKYEVEGQKVQFDTNALTDYYCKMLNDHPLVSYVEDCFHQFDFNQHKIWREKLANEFAHVNMGLKHIFKSGGLQRFKGVTEYQEFDKAEIERQMQLRSE